eukprot:TRINITY_DN15298_c0_g1_i1.p1 TRINITY_DN15298_c0_g1~~TRINITY_DN15298_c0_g1_i1.p1  ORF type:complete len:351 (+),score=86.69 TRINITY_DN15298_c0_g1_i1:82-1134(+)
MASVDTSFLKDELGPVLARGIAETVCALPKDPVEYLGLWLQHYLNEKESETTERAKEEEMKILREEWNRQQLAKEKTASTIIQKEWKNHSKAMDERNLRETELRARLEAFGDHLDEEGEYDPESVGPEMLTDPEAKEEEKECELDMYKSEKLFLRWQLYVRELSRENIVDIKLMQKVPEEVLKTIRCTFYLLGKLPSTKPNGEKIDATPSRLKTWAQTRANIKPYTYLEQLKSFDPSAIPKRRILRVKRILIGTKLGDEAIKKQPGGQTVYIISQLLWSAIEYRCYRDDVFRMKKANGKDMPGMDTWEDDPGDDIDNEEKDEDEEAQRKIEELNSQNEADGGEEGEAAGE